MSSMHQGNHGRNKKQHGGKQHNEISNLSMHSQPGCTIGPTMNQYRGKVDSHNRRSQSPYLHINLSGLNFKNFHSFTRPFRGYIHKDFHTFPYSRILNNNKVWDDKQGPIHPTLFPSSHHERRLYTIEVQLRPFPETWTLLPHENLSKNTNT